jgi:hypothetical protein
VHHRFKVIFWQINSIGKVQLFEPCVPRLVHEETRILLIPRTSCGCRGSGPTVRKGRVLRPSLSRVRHAHGGGFAGSESCRRPVMGL